MDRILRNSLLALGCDDKQIRLFVAYYIHGTAPLSEVVTQARLPRATGYVVAKELVDKGLLIEDHKAYGKSFTAIPPEALAQMVAAKQRSIGRQHIAISENIGELQTLYSANEVQPKVKTYQGANGLLTVWRDILTAQSNLLLWTDQSAEENIFTPLQHQQFIKERVARSIYIRVLAVANHSGMGLTTDDHSLLRETRLLPTEISFSAETYIYDNKVAILDYNQDIMGVLIESKQIALAQRAMFESAWQSATIL